MVPAPSRCRPDGNLFACALAVAAAANGLSAASARAIAVDGWTGAMLSTFGLSSLAVAALVAATALLLADAPHPLRSSEEVLGLVLAPAIAFPEPAFAWGCLTLVAAYLVLRPFSLRARAAGFILLALAVNGFWGHLFLVLAAPEVTALDAKLVGALTSLAIPARVDGNVVSAASGASLVVLLPCSSFSGLSSGVLAWATLARYVRPRGRRGEWAGLTAVAGAIFFLNVLRMSLMLASEPLYWTLHDGVGAQIFNLTVLGASLLIAFHGVRHDLARPRPRGNDCRRWSLWHRRQVRSFGRT